MYNSICIDSTHRHRTESSDRAVFARMFFFLLFWICVDIYFMFILVVGIYLIYIILSRLSYALRYNTKIVRGFVAIAATAVVAVAAAVLTLFFFCFSLAISFYPSHADVHRCVLFYFIFFYIHSYRFPCIKWICLKIRMHTIGVLYLKAGGASVNTSKKPYRWTSCPEKTEQYLLVEFIAWTPVFISYSAIQYGYIHFNS